MNFISKHLWQFRMIDKLIMQRFTAINTVKKLSNSNETNQCGTMRSNCTNCLSDFCWCEKPQTHVLTVDSAQTLLFFKKFPLCFVSPPTLVNWSHCWNQIVMFSALNVIWFIWFTDSHFFFPETLPLDNLQRKCLKVLHSITCGHTGV